MSSKTVKLWQAINMAIAEEMERDDRVFMMGEDIARAGGTFGETRGLLDRFGPDRIRDTPISEAAILGAGVGAAMVGMRPICEILFIDFLGIASDQLVNQAAKQRYFSGGRVSVPLVVKSGVGSGFGMGAQHSQSLEGWYGQVPGLKVCWPSTPADARGLMKAAIRDEGPVLYLETFAHLRVLGEVVEDDEVVPLGSAAVAREGTDITAVTYGTCRPSVIEAANRLADRGVSLEVIDLRTVMPWDQQTVCSSVSRTNRCIVVTDAVRAYGPGGEIASTVAEECFDDLDAPVMRVTSPRVPAPQLTDYEAWRIPSADDVIAAAGAMLGIAFD